MTTLPDSVRRGVARWAVKSVLFTAVFAGVLFGAAGTLRWPMAWAYAAIYLANQVVLARLLPAELLAERSTAQAGTKRWDMALSIAVALAFPLLIYLAAGLDWRQGGASVGPIVQGGALVVMVSGIALTSWAMKANAYFSGTVRIQEDRGHTVVDRGPYAWMRHPGYAGGIAHHLAAPLMLGSAWALIPGAVGALLLVIRTAMEDRTLRAELPGYTEYAQRVRYRLIPGVW